MKHALAHTKSTYIHSTWKWHSSTFFDIDKSSLKILHLILTEKIWRKKKEQKSSHCLYFNFLSFLTTSTDLDFSLNLINFTEKKLTLFSFWNLTRLHLAEKIIPSNTNNTVLAITSFHSIQTLSLIRGTPTFRNSKRRRTPSQPRNQAQPPTRPRPTSWTSLAYPHLRPHLRPLPPPSHLPPVHLVPTRPPTTFYN